MHSSVIVLAVMMDIRGLLSIIKDFLKKELSLEPVLSIQGFLEKKKTALEPSVLVMVSLVFLVLVKSYSPSLS